MARNVQCVYLKKEAAGLPATTAYGGTDVMTTAPAPARPGKSIASVLGQPVSSNIGPREQVRLADSGLWDRQRDFYDSDVAVVQSHGPIEQIFAAHGEPHFRALERAAVSAGVSPEIGQPLGMIHRPVSREVTSKTSTLPR